MRNFTCIIFLNLCNFLKRLWSRLSALTDACHDFDRRLRVVPRRATETSAGPRPSPETPPRAFSTCVSLSAMCAHLKLISWHRFILCFYFFTVTSLCIIKFIKAISTLESVKIYFLYDFIFFTFCISDQSRICLSVSSCVFRLRAGR